MIILFSPYIWILSIYTVYMPDGARAVTKHSTGGSNKEVTFNQSTNQLSPSIWILSLYTVYMPDGATAVTNTKHSTGGSNKDEVTDIMVSLVSSPVTRLAEPSWVPRYTTYLSWSWLDGQWKTSTQLMVSVKLVSWWCTGSPGKFKCCILIMFADRV